MTIGQAQMLPWEFVTVGVLAMVIGAAMIVKCDQSLRSHVWYCPRGRDHSWTGHDKKCPRCGTRGSTEPFEHNLVRTRVAEEPESNENFEEPPDD